MLLVQSDTNHWNVCITERITTWKAPAQKLFPDLQQMKQWSVSVNFALKTNKVFVAWLWWRTKVLQFQIKGSRHVVKSTAQTTENIHFSPVQILSYLLFTACSPFEGVWRDVITFVLWIQWCTLPSWVKQPSAICSFVLSKSWQVLLFYYYCYFLFRWAK